MDIEELKKRIPAFDALAFCRERYDIRSDTDTVRDAHEDGVMAAFAAFADTIESLQRENEQLRKRLEIDPRHNYDGIDCRDVTIRELERGQQADGREIQDGQRVEVRLHGDEEWYPGTVIKARKQWVQLDPERYPDGEFVTDEGQIAEWRLCRQVEG